MKLQVDDQIDRGLRETVTVNGIPVSGPTETWEQCKALLADQLSSLSNGIHKPSFFGDAIIRAHRGKGKSAKNV